MDSTSRDAASDWVKLIREVLEPAHEGAIEAWMCTPKASRFYCNPLEAQEGALVEVLLSLSGANLSLHGTQDESNPYLQVYDWCMQRIPHLGLKLFKTVEEIAPAEHQVLSELVLDATQPLLRWRADLGHFVSSSVYDNFHRFVHEPLTNHFAFAIPNQEAINLLVKYSPIIEIGAGTGYWASLAQAAGAQVEAYDIVDCGQPRGRHFMNVLPGGSEMLEKIPHGQLSESRTLLLCWPVRPGGLPWDVEALQRFRGDTVIHVGEWADSTALVEPVHGQTTSLAFQNALQISFKQIDRVPIPNWPWCRDVVTVWKRLKVYS
mmetsp:Transcript_20934/g.39793  ORF Transcript_20934/g.39793 Transcript_20934/m.39793 type:complete len:320 (+) Transcript_20934:127-1086(+)